MKKIFPETSINRHDVEYFLERDGVTYFIKINGKAYELYIMTKKPDVHNMTRSMLIPMMNQVVNQRVRPAFHNVVMYSYKDDKTYHALIPNLSDM